MQKKDLKYWLAMEMIKGLSRGVSMRLLERFVKPQSIFESIEEFKHGDKIRDIVYRIKKFNKWGEIEDKIALMEKKGIEIITIRDKRYPDILKATYDPPIFVYAKGKIECMQSNAVAIVGTRYPTHYGMRMSESIARELSLRGIVVVSGMARGCDSAAHRGAISVKGMTIAVLGAGIDVPYPKENKKLYEQIIDNGLVISEYPMGSQPYPQNFPQRNRIISGLSLGVLVVEASKKSGALITANCALDCGREVFAVPGNVTSINSMGTNHLIKNGARLVDNALDIIESLSFSNNISTTSEDTSMPENLKGDEKKIIGELNNGEQLSIDNLIQKTGLPAQRVLSILLDMELNGLVQQYPGKFYARRG